MSKLSVNVDHVATLRQVRKGNEPDPVYAAVLAELGGCDGIIVHLREDRRHIQVRDLELLKKIIKTKLNLEMAVTDEMLTIALKIKPDLATLVPERRQELTTEGGLDVILNQRKIYNAIKKLHKKSIPVSLFVNPDIKQIEMCKKVSADFVEIHTGIYSESETEKSKQFELQRIKTAVEKALGLGLKVNLGHGLNYQNIKPLLKIKGINEFSIGHSIISRAVFVGIERAVREMVELIKEYGE